MSRFEIPYDTVCKIGHPLKTIFKRKKKQKKNPSTAVLKGGIKVVPKYLGQLI